MILPVGEWFFALVGAAEDVCSLLVFYRVIHPIHEKNHFKYSANVPNGYGARAG
jgi:hypothetical protein